MSRNKVNTEAQSELPTLTVWQLICFGALSLPIAMGGLVLAAFIPTYYAVDLGLGLSLVGFIFVAGRLLDVITDPIIGYLSDKTQSPYGPRRPWIIIGLPFYCLAVWCLFSPPETATLTYLIIASGAYFLFYTIVDIPFSSVGLEISPYTDERSILASAKGIFQTLGAVFAALVPIIWALETGASLSLTAKLLIGFCVTGLCLFLMFVPHRDRTVTAHQQSFIKTFKQTWVSRPYRFIIGAFLLTQTSSAFTVALTVLYVTNIIGAPELIGIFICIVLLSSALFMPVWVWASKRWSKKIAWTASIIICCLLLSFTPYFGAGDIIPYAIFCAFIGGTTGCDAIMPTSMLADIVYADEHEGKPRLAGLYLAGKNSVSKLTFIAPMGLAFPILELAGFTSGSYNSPQTLFMLLFFYALLPILIKICALFIVLKMPNTETLQTA